MGEAADHLPGGASYRAPTTDLTRGLGDDRPEPGEPSLKHRHFDAGDSSKGPEVRFPFAYPPRVFTTMALMLGDDSFAISRERIRDDCRELVIAEYVIHSGLQRSADPFSAIVRLE